MLEFTFPGRSWHRDYRKILKQFRIMFRKNISTEKSKTLVWAATAVFAVAAALYFLPMEIPCKNVFPVAVLAVFSLWLDPFPMSMALVVSAFGDLMASAGNFMAQMECFAVAHLFLCLFFVQRLFRTGQASGKTFAAILTGKRMAYLVVTGICVGAVMLMAMVSIVPEVPGGVMRAGVAFYSIVISLMLFTALLQRSIFYAVAAVLFVISDFILGWNRFVEPVEGETYYVMAPYFAAQWMFFARATKYRTGKSLLVARL